MIHRPSGKKTFQNIRDGKRQDGSSDRKRMIGPVAISRKRDSSIAISQARHSAIDVVDKSPAQRRIDILQRIDHRREFFDALSPRITNAR